MNKNEDLENGEGHLGPAGKPRGRGKVGRPWEIWRWHRKGAEESTHTHTHFKFSQRIALGLPTKSTPFPSPPFVSREDEAALLVLLGAKKS